MVFFLNLFYITAREADWKLLGSYCFPRWRPVISNFKIENSIFLARPILNGSGKGITNVKQRLEIIYPGKHKLSVGEKENVYSVELEIDLT